MVRTSHPHVVQSVMQSPALQQPPPTWVTGKREPPRVEMTHRVCSACVPPRDCCGRAKRLLWACKSGGDECQAGTTPLTLYATKRNGTRACATSSTLHTTRCQDMFAARMSPHHIPMAMAIARAASQFTSTPVTSTTAISPLLARRHTPQRGGVFVRLGIVTPKGVLQPALCHASVTRGSL